MIPWLPVAPLFAAETVHVEIKIPSGEAAPPIHDIHGAVEPVRVNQATQFDTWEATLVLPAWVGDQTVPVSERVYFRKEASSIKRCIIQAALAPEAKDLRPCSLLVTGWVLLGAASLACARGAGRGDPAP